MIYRFQGVPIGDLFITGGKMYRKIEPKWKTCCICEYNAEQVDTGTKAYFGASKEIEWLTTEK
jgi:hypothetical protein